MFSMTKVQIHSIIKGYHAYKRKPANGSMCNVIVEPDNNYDCMAVAVISSDGKMIGHVPASPIPLHMVFHEILDLSKSININW